MGSRHSTSTPTVAATPSTSSSSMSMHHTSSSSGSSISNDYDYTVAILGDLHIDPRKMDDYSIGRSHFQPIFNEAKSKSIKNGEAGAGGCALVSLGDLGHPKNCNHNPHNDLELFAGTTQCHELAATFLNSFVDDIPYDVVGGNHDLEGLQEFKTDEENLAMYLRVHGKDAPYFCREVAEKTLLVGMGSTVFRGAKYISHEVTIDREQMDWFENLVETHPAEEGWKLFVFTHAPPIGSGLRVLQENQIVDGCCWLNHNDEKQRTKFIELVREHRCIKAWFSGHFHLGQDNHGSITFPTIDSKDSPNNRGSCVFAQTSVMRSETTRDARQQSRLLRGNKHGFEICTVDHQKDGKIRVDATVSFEGDASVVCSYTNEDGVYDHEKYAKIVKFHQPTVGDDGFKKYNLEGNIDPFDIETNTHAWWHMPCGRALGMFNGKLIEYDSTTLAPIGLVIDADELVDKKICVINKSGLNADRAGCLDEQAVVVLLDKKGGHVKIVQPNEDGSYWRKYDRNRNELFPSRVVQAS